MRHESMKTLTVARLPSNVRIGDVLELHGRGTYRVRSIDGSVVLLRSLRFYERLWQWTERKARAVVRRLTSR